MVNADERDADFRACDLRASDAERDAVVADLGQHFQDGRLDKAEFDQRVSAAMTARTRRDLAALVADLPGRQPDSAATPAADQAPARDYGDSRDSPDCGRPRARGLLPLVIAAVIVAGLIGRGWHHDWFLWLVIPVVLVRLSVLRGRRCARPFTGGGQRSFTGGGGQRFTDGGPWQ